MRLSHILRLAIATGLGATALTVAGTATPAHARIAEHGAACLTPKTNAAAAAARGGAAGLDHRGITPAEQRAIARRTSTQLAAKGTSSIGESAVVTRVRVPVHVHVMRSAAGRGNVTNYQITRQIAVMNKDFADTPFNFDLVSIDRFKNTSWHKDQQSATYRARTRKGGANALNVWLVDFAYLGIATFPWDYAKKGAIDGIRVDYDSLPGGSITNFNLGGTATHETGHWLGLYHTFQGGCTQLNDQVSDTPAQMSPTSGCPASRDSCPLTGNDPIHNFMDYSFDSCYTNFTSGQSSRAARMWSAYRG
jgi:hypothetical protein